MSNLIKKIDFALNSNTCQPENYTKLIGIRKAILHKEQLTGRQMKVLKTEQLF